MSNDDSRSRGRLVPAVAVGLLFAIMALTVLSADFGEVAAFPADASIVHTLGTHSSTSASTSSARCRPRASSPRS